MGKITDLLTAYPSFLIRRKYLIIIAFTLITILSILSAVRIRVDNDIEIWIGNNGKEFTVYRNFTRIFGSDENIILLVHSDSLFTADFLKDLHNLTDTLKSVKGVKQITSLCSIQLPVISIDGAYEVPLIPQSVNNPGRIKNKILKYASINGHLISPDGKTTAVAIDIADPSEAKNILNTARNLTNDCLGNGIEVVEYGIIPVKTEIDRLSVSEAEIFLTLAVVFMFILTWLIYGRFRLAIIPISAALVSILWTLGLMSSFGVTLNILLSSMPLIMLVISIAFSVHFVSAMAEQAEMGNHGETAVLKSFRKIFKNSFFSALTTIVAMLVFCGSPIIPLSHFGIFAAIGVAFSFIITFSLLPVIFVFVKIPEPERRPKLQWNGIAERISMFISGYSRMILGAGLLLLIFAVVGILQLRVNTDQKTYLKRHNPVRCGIEKAQIWFSGIIPFNVIITADKSLFEDGMEELPEKVDSLFGQCPEVKSWQSLQLFKEDYLRSNLSAFSSFYIDSQIVASSGMLSQFITPDGKTMRMIVKTGWMGDNQILEFKHSLEEKFAVLLKDTPAKVEITGAIPLFAVMGRKLVNSQISSIIWSFLLIFLIFLILYRKVKWALLAMIPNVIPVLVTLGVMGFTGIPVDVATVLIASVSFGIAVDDTIHFTGTFRLFRKNYQAQDSMSLALKNIGKPLVITSFMLISGFLLLTMSAYRPLIFLGSLISLNLFLALLCDILLMPSLLLKFKM
jgi:uncharacterized protein